jgi:hypothetical protein
VTRAVQPSLTDHALRRAQQRGITGNRLRRFLDLADREEPAGRGCVAVSLSLRAARRFCADGTCGSAEVERLIGLRAVIGHDGSLVTIMHGRRPTWSGAVRQRREDQPCA